MLSEWLSELMKNVEKQNTDFDQCDIFRELIAVVKKKKYLKNCTFNYTKYKTFLHVTVSLYSASSVVYLCTHTSLSGDVHTHIYTDSHTSFLLPLLHPRCFSRVFLEVLILLFLLWCLCPYSCVPLSLSLAVSYIGHEAVEY